MMTGKMRRGEGILADKVRNEKAVDDAVDRGDDHHQNAGRDKAQQLLIRKMIGKGDGHKRPPCLKSGEATVVAAREERLVIADADDDVGLIGGDIVADALRLIVPQVDRAHLVEAVIGEALHGVGEAVAEDEDARKLRAVRAEDRFGDVAAHVELVGQRLRVGRGEGVDRGGHLLPVVKAGEGDILSEGSGEQLFVVAAEPQELARARAHVGVRQRGKRHIRALFGEGEREAVSVVQRLHGGAVGLIRAAEAVVVVHL